jgi:ankyrin repeat protein
MTINNSHYNYNLGKELIEAASYNDISKLNTLLNNPEVDINATDTDKKTALIWATERRQLKCVAQLLSHPQINSNFQDRDLKTPLMYAVEKGIFVFSDDDRSKLINMLLDHKNIDLTIKDSQGRTACTIAFKNNYLEIAQKLFDKIEKFDDKYYQLWKIHQPCPLLDDFESDVEYDVEVKNLSKLFQNKTKFLLENFQKIYKQLLLLTTPAETLCSDAASIIAEYAALMEWEPGEYKRISNKLEKGVYRFYMNLLKTLDPLLTILPFEIRKNICNFLGRNK